MINLQVQQTNVRTGDKEILFTIETEASGKAFMTNELHLMYDERATEDIEIKVVEVNES